MAWNESNIATLRSFDKAAIAEFATGPLGDFSGHGDSCGVEPKDIGDFNWVDLADDGQYQLVMTLDVNGRAFFNALLIFRREPSGKITYQEVRGWAIGDLKEVVKDLDGDGKKELVIPEVFVSHSTAETATWPEVYRLEKGMYKEASRDFPSFYNDEVLPQLGGRIDNVRQEINKIPNSKSHRYVEYRQSLQGKLADLITERDKILRLTGSDPTAGLEDARNWMNSDNPALLQDAAVTFKDLGGYENEARVAAKAYRAHTWHGVE